MSRTPASFKQADLARVFRAIKAADINMSVEITREGIIRINPIELPHQLQLPPGPDRGEIIL